MEVTRILSTTNAAVKNAASLKQKKFRDELGLFVVEGMKMLKEAVSAGMNIKNLFVLEEIYNKDKQFFESLEVTEIYVTNEAVIEKISDWVTPQGIIVIIEKKTGILDDILNKEEAFVLVLDGVSDPGNIGTMIRTSEAAAVDAIITASGTADCFQPKALRASMGSSFRIWVFENFERCDIIYKLKSKGFEIVSTSLEGKNVLNDCTNSKKTALVLGNEGAGISKELADNADMLVRLPMAGKVESLNVAVSAGIMMYMLNNKRI